MRMRWIPYLVVAVLLALGLTTPALAATPDGQSPDGAIALSDSASGSLVGNPGGSFQYYSFNYPGDGSVGTLSLGFSPGNLAAANGFGVNLYQAGVRLVGGNGVSNAFGTSSLTFSSKQAGPVLVQVYNYNPTTVDYDLALSGVDQSAAPASPAPVPAAPLGPVGSASNPVALDGSASGNLPSDRHGGFVYYTFDSPGDGSTQTVALDFTPIGNNVANAIVLTLFQNGQQIATAQGNQLPKLGHLTASYQATTAGPILVQVANYNFDATIGYTISR